METRRVRRDAVYGRGTHLRGIDLVERIAANTKIQKQRWIDIYYCLCERKAKVDIAETVVIVDGTPTDWFFTSSATGEIQRKPDHHLNAITIKKHFVRASDLSAVARPIALLVHEDTGGDMAYALLNDLDFNLALCQVSSPLWNASFLLQPFLTASQQHPQCTGTYVAKFHHATTTSCIRVFRTANCFQDLKQSDAAPPSRAVGSSASAARARRPASAPPPRSSIIKHKTAPTPRSVEELIRAETAKLVKEIEAATTDTLRQLHAEFQITHTHRLVLMRVARVVFASDLKRASRGDDSPSRGRPASVGLVAANRRCTGGRFCHCKAFPAGETSTAKSSDLQQITRKSLQLCEEESQFLDAFGAHAEAHLDTHTPQTRGPSLELNERLADPSAHETFKRVLQRRLFMLRSTVWNPNSDSFHAKPLAWEDERTKQPQQYEMVRVCRTCYLIYHAMDAERFQATKSTVKAAARRLTLLHNAKMLGENGPRPSGSRATEQSQVNHRCGL